jgi:hypothetical protein
MGMELTAGRRLLTRDNLGGSATRRLARLVEALFTHAAPGDGAWLCPSNLKPELNHDRHNHRNDA